MPLQSQKHESASFPRSALVSVAYAPKNATVWINAAMGAREGEGREPAGADQQAGKALSVCLSRSWPRRSSSGTAGRNQVRASRWEPYLPPLPRANPRPPPTWNPLVFLEPGARWARLRELPIGQPSPPI